MGKVARPEDAPLSPHAWLVRCTDPVHGAEVIFGGTRNEVRAAWQGCDCDYVELRAKRAPEYDGLEGQLTTRRLIEQFGWQFECGHCTKLVHAETEGACYSATGEDAYCSTTCRDKAAREQGVRAHG